MPASPANPPFRFHDLEGRSLLITGVTSGIGKALLGGFLDQGLNIIAVSRGLDAMQAIRRELGVGDDRLRLFDCDLRHPGAVRETVDGILRERLPVDFLLHNAAIDPRETFEAAGTDHWDEVFQVNVFAAASLTRLLLPLLRRSGQGRIVFTGSVVFDLGASFLSAYGASKGAIVGLTRALAHELKDSGITVNCVQPGAIQVEKEDVSVLDHQRVIGWQSVPRRLQPDDLLGMLCLLFSAAGGAISAQTITIDGGFIHPLADPSAQGGHLDSR